MSELPRPHIAQLVHHVVAAAAEVVVQPHVALVERVVGVGAALVRHGTRRALSVPIAAAAARMSGCRPAATAACIAEPSAGPCSEPITCSGIRVTSA